MPGRRDPGRDLPAWPAALPRRLSVRRAPRPSDPRHAAHAAGSQRAHAKPVGFVANDYALSVWGLSDMASTGRDGRLDLADLLDEDMLGDDLDAWLAELSLMKRSFRVCAIISGLIERRHPGQEKTGRQMTISSDLIYDVLRQHEPDHILLQAAFADAATGLIDVGRLSGFLQRIRGRIRHIPLTRSLAARRAGHARDRPRKRSRRCERSLAARGGRGVDSRGDGAACCA